MEKLVEEIGINQIRKKRTKKTNEKKRTGINKRIKLNLEKIKKILRNGHVLENNNSFLLHLTKAS